MKNLQSIDQLVDSLTLFPSIGFKSAERMAYALLDMSKEDINRLVKNIENAKTKIHQCPICGSLTEEDQCNICKDTSRNHSTCIVVANPKDVFSFEKIGEFNCVYHVLNGLINPSKNVGPEDLNIAKLLDRIKPEGIKELIIATNGSSEGEITALYIAKLLENEDVNVSRIGYGMPIGASFDYLDSLTIEKALKNRTIIKK